ncbi:ligase-associated DNA damage response exonuclease [Silvimonas sp. JCM 19000]
MNLVVARPEGLYCPPGDFYIDPWRPVERAVITHGHSDHARWGHAHYLASQAGLGILRARLGEINVQGLPYGETLLHHGVKLSLHPAGHVLGSAQVRLEYAGEVWVASGDYKTQYDPTCLPFEPVRCHTFITESTFGLPIYRWQDPTELFDQVNAWWRSNAAQGRPSVLYCYAFGKAQRILASIDPAIGPLIMHGAIEPLNRMYREQGVQLPETRYAGDVEDRALARTALILAPPSASGSTWLRRFPDYAEAFASGWMQVRGNRRRRGIERGFALSDHADWPGLNWAIAQTGAQNVYVTHGSTDVLVRHLRDQGLNAQIFKTEYGDEDDTPPASDDAAAPAEGAS